MRSLLALTQRAIRLDLPALDVRRIRITQTRLFGFVIAIRLWRGRRTRGVDRTATTLYFRLERREPIRVGSCPARRRGGLDEIEVEIVIRSIISGTASARITAARISNARVINPTASTRIRRAIVVDAGKQKTEKSLQELAHGCPYDCVPVPTA
ncbi:hypothetical protein WI97_11275 [Burkholderia vietnamiensis]|nr:hypothetical protein WI97_11275 [Burkholderia vietnamiensis]